MKITRDQIVESLRIYGISIGISLLGFLLTCFLAIILQKSPPFLLLLVSVTASTWYVGLRAGAFSTLFLSILAIFFFLPPYTFSISNMETNIYLLVFLLSSGGTMLIIYKSRVRKQVKAFAEREEEYVDQIHKLQKENLHLQKEVKARDEFLSIASHELKTPLTSMLLQMQTALHNIRNTSLANFSVERLMKMLESTEQQSVRLSKMINDLLNVSLITTGRMELEKADMDLTELVKEVTERFNEKAEKEGLQIKVNTNGKIIGTWDTLRIEQVITNLLSNAIKYGNNKPIEITASKDEGFARLTVADHGIGIPRERQERIFERFERAVNHNHYQGLGVGLYITYQIVKAHKGSIKLSSKQNAGSVFTVELPLKKAKE